MKNFNNSTSQIITTTARFFLLLIFLILPALSFGQEATNPLAKAQTLIDSGKAEEAYDLLKPYQASLEGEAAFDYICVGFLVFYVF